MATPIVSVELPVVTLAIFGVIGFAVRRIINRIDALGVKHEESAKELNVQTLALSVLVEQVRPMGDRLHAVETRTGTLSENVAVLSREVERTVSWIDARRNTPGV